MQIEPKDVQRKVLTDSGLVCQGPCLLISVIATMASTQRWVKLRDGLDENAELGNLVQGSSKASVIYQPVIEEYYPQGLYVEVEGSITAVVVRFVKLQQGA